MLTIEPLDALRPGLQGEIVTPADAGWDAARQAWNVTADQRPVLVALPEHAGDVAAIVDYARERGLRIAPQGTGHNATPLAWDEDTILLSTARMRSVDIDPVARRARVEAGVLWLEVTEKSSPHGLAPLSGSSPDVGVVGYTLGGGLSWLARRHGLAANSVLAVEIVTADGRLRRVDAATDADLFWALRGGGGSFGVVTAMEFALYEAPHVYAGSLWWPAARAAEVAHAWRQWTATAPDEVTSALRVLNMPPIDLVPEPLRGRSWITVDGAILHDENAAAALLRPLRGLGPEIDMWGPIPPVELSRIHGDPEDPTPALSTSTMLRELPAEAIDAFVAAAGPDFGSPLVGAELRHLGGAVARAAEGAGAIARLDGAYALYAFGVPMTPELGAAISGYLPRLKAALAPWSDGRGYLNFEEQPAGAETFFDAATLERLRAVKAAVDPLGIFRANHPV